MAVPRLPARIKLGDECRQELERRWNEVAEPLEWNLTRDDLAELMDRLAAHEPQLRLAA